MKKFSRIFLIGFRATGKSTLGKLLADKLGWSFLDLDFLIFQQANEDIGTLTKNGSDWRKFRKLENETLEEVSTLKNVVISCGGGVGVNDVIDDKTRKTFGQLNKKTLKSSEDNLVILLTSTDEVIEKRLQQEFSKKRIMPYLNSENIDGGTDLKKQVNDSMQALQKRKELYGELADFEIDTSKFEFPEKLANINISIGDPMKHSLSPAMHNAGYEALNIDQANLFIPCRVKKEKLEKFIEAVKVLGINGISVTLPHKESVIEYLDEVDETAKKIGAVNTILNKGGKLIGRNTDWIGAITAVEKKTSLKGKKAAVIGAGGVARAIVFGLSKKGAKVKIFNRTLEKAKRLAEEFKCEFGDIGDIREVRNYNIIINATSVGMDMGESPVSKNLFDKRQVVFDVVYSPKETRFLKSAKEKGAKVIYGYEMLLYQGVEQFKLYTGLEAPVKEMEEVLINAYG